jgi:hypothetical protein
MLQQLYRSGFLIHRSLSSRWVLRGLALGAKTTMNPTNAGTRGGGARRALRNTERLLAAATAELRPNIRRSASAALDCASEAPEGKGQGDTHFAITSVITSVACEKTVCEHAHWGSLCVQQWHLQQGRWRVGNGRFNEPFKAWQVEDETMLATESAPISTAPPPSPQVSQASGCRVYKCRNLILT